MTLSPASSPASTTGPLGAALAFVLMTATLVLTMVLLPGLALSRYDDPGYIQRIEACSATGQI